MSNASNILKIVDLVILGLATLPEVISRLTGLLSRIQEENTGGAPITRDEVKAAREEVEAALQETQKLIDQLKAQEEQ